MRTPSSREGLGWQCRSWAVSSNPVASTLRRGGKGQSEHSRPCWRERGNIYRSPGGRSPRVRLGRGPCHWVSRHWSHLDRHESFSSGCPALMTPLLGGAATVSGFGLPL